MVLTATMESLFFPTTLKALCAQYGLTPSKQYGQNYLISEKPIREMVAAADLQTSDVVVEIGPGFGVLTLAVAPGVKKLISFEIEKKLQGYWEEKQKELPSLEIVWGNFIYQFGEIQSTFPKKYKVMANIPYQITSQILRLLLEAEHKPERIIVMVQKEVAQRICAKPGEMSLLAISVQYYGEPKMICKVTKGNFFPAPKVDSAVLMISNIRPASAQTTAAEKEFFEVVRAGFAHPRKQLWSNLAEKFPAHKEHIKSILKDVAGDEKIRAEELSVEQWKKIVQEMSPRGGISPPAGGAVNKKYDF